MYIYIIYLYFQHFTLYFSIELYIYQALLLHNGSFLGGSVLKNPPANAGDAGSILGLERFPEEEMATLSSILAWEIPWTEKPGGLQSMGVTKYSDRT